VLSRIWDASKPVGAFLCANPSKADELRHDDTVFKCGNMAANWSWGGFHVLNLYPSYSTDPNQVVHDSAADATNAYWVVKLLQEAPIVVVACGNGHQERLGQLIQEIPKSKIYCLRRNKGGGFQHPSRIQPEDFPSPVPAFDFEV
jgi:hypothetical protein